MTLRKFNLLILDGETAEVERLLGANPSLANLTDEKGRAPLDMAASRGHVDIARLLISHGAEINHRDKVYGTFPLLQAVCRGHCEIVALLIERGADVHLKDHEGQTALSLADGIGRDEIATLLKQAILDRGRAEGS